MREPDVALPCRSPSPNRSAGASSRKYQSVALTMRVPAANSTAIPRGRAPAENATSTSGGPPNCVQTGRDACVAYDDVFAFLDRGEFDPRQSRHCSSCRKTKDALRDFTGELKTCRFCLHDRKRSAKKRRLQARIAKAVAEHARCAQPSASIARDVDAT